MASTLQMVAPATAPIDIQPSHSLCLSPPSLSSSCSGKSPALGESPGDSGYESSWPSLSEAAAWSLPPGQKRHLSLKPTGVSGVPGSPDCSAFGSYGKKSRLSTNVTIKNGKGPQQRLTQGQGHCGQGEAQHKGKGQRRRVRTEAYQAKRMAQLQSMAPLVDFGSPQMEDDDQTFGPVDPPIPLSVIPRGWLYEEDFATSLAEEVLIALPKREWVYDSSGPMSMDAKSFAVMSWNILSPRLCHASRLHDECEPAFLDWSYRREAILNQIAFTDADIICLQELERKDYDEYFNPHLSRLGFRSIHAYKMNVYEMRDGCAIFYRDSRFKLLSEHVLRFNQVELDDLNVKRPSMARDTAIRFNLFHNLAIVALFENRRTKRQVQVATTHLLADPAFPDAKMLQTAILTSKLEELKAEAITTASPPIMSSATATLHPQQQHHIPTILAGDFNSLPDSSVVNFLKTGQVDRCHFGDNDFGRFTRAESKDFYHHLGLVDSYKSSILPFTNATRKFQGTIDYLLYDPSSLGLVGFMDHFEMDPVWTAHASVAANTHMSSSDLDSEMEADVPLSSSSASSSSMSLDSTTRRKKASKKTAKKIQYLDFSKLFSPSATLNSTTDAQDKSDSAVMRAPMPTALPSQHFPSDHIPLVSIFRERESMPVSPSP